MLREGVANLQCKHNKRSKVDKVFLTLAMTSQYIGDKVSKSSSPDPRKILSFAWCVM